MRDTLIKEAYDILNNDSFDLNKQRDKLTNIFDQLVTWKENADEDTRFYEDFQDIVLSMAQLDFSKRFNISNQRKTLYNFLAVSMNTLNEEYEDNIVSLKLLTALLEGLPVKNLVVIGTNPTGKVNYFYSDNNTLFPNPKIFLSQNIHTFFENIEEINNTLVLKGSLQEIPAQMTLGYKGPVSLKVITPSWLTRQEGIFYLISIPAEQQ
jgi:hypothetical protein